ncbi:Ribosomal protein L11 methyltransferase [Clarias magur]|uniref:Ribosomal protein L11 methyltransferase n=1 Tax=Clarias magur TaxID=1594786 RepID=A0A8J4UVC2_CLAMG|nr:Ribosomal protein L11 methyltransferase [Clarias magur]
MAHIRSTRRQAERSRAESRAEERRGSSEHDATPEDGYDLPVSQKLRVLLSPEFNTIGLGGDRLLIQLVIVIAKIPGQILREVTSKRRTYISTSLASQPGPDGCRYGSERLGTRLPERNKTPSLSPSARSWQLCKLLYPCSGCDCSEAERWRANFMDSFPWT